MDVTAATATVDPASNGLKFELTSTPAGGSLAGTSNLALSSGTQAVTWAMEAPVQGDLSGASSTSVTYNGPGTLTNLAVGIVKATSTTGNPAKMTFFPVWMNPSVSSGSVTISGSTGTLAPFSSRTFTATVTGGSTNNVQWSVQSSPPGASSSGQFTPLSGCTNGLSYRAPSTVPTAGNVTIKATSCDNAAWSNTIVVPVTAGSSVSISPISPTPATVAASQQFSATVSNADTSTVQWSVTPAGAGTISASGLYTVSSGFSGNATVTARSSENPSVSTQWQFIADSPQSGGISFSPPNGTTDSLLTVTVNGGSSVTNIGEVWVNLSSAASSNQLPSGSVCRFRYSRFVLPDRIQLDDRHGAFSAIQDARFGTSDAPNNGVCAIIGSQSSVTTSGSSLTLNIRIQNRAISGTRYAYVWTALPQNQSSAMPPQQLANWSPAAASGITITSTQGSTPVVPSGTQVILMAQTTAMQVGWTIAWTLNVPDGKFDPTPLPPGYQGAILYTADNSGSARVVRAYGRILNASGVEQASAYIDLTVNSSLDQPPSLDFLNPITSSNVNPSVANQTLVADGSSWHSLHWGIKNTGYPAESCTGTTCFNIDEIYLNINRTQSASGLAQDLANGCRVKVKNIGAGGGGGYRIDLMDDAGLTYSGEIYNPQSGGNFRMSNSQCTVEFITANGAYVASTYGEPTILVLGMRFRFHIPFKGQRFIYMMGQRPGSGGWSGWQSRGTLNLN